MITRRVEVKSHSLCTEELEHEHGDDEQDGDGAADRQADGDVAEAGADTTPISNAMLNSRIGRTATAPAPAPATAARSYASPLRICIWRDDAYSFTNASRMLDGNGYRKRTFAYIFICLLF